MPDRSRADEVASGAPYVVRTVNDHPPTDLADFLGEPVVVLTVERRQQQVCIHGESRLDGDAVIVYEKDSDGTGKDVRTWSVRRNGAQFEAGERAVF